MLSPANIKAKLLAGATCVLLATSAGLYAPVAFASEQVDQIDLETTIQEKLQAVAAKALLNNVSTLDDTGESLPVVGVGSVITEGGTYQLEPYSNNGIITVATTEAVTIVGSGVSSGKSSYVTIDCTVAGVDLTLQDVRIDNADDKNYSAVRFTGKGNVLTIEGVNSLQQCYNNAGDLAIIYVPQDGSLTIQGTGTLYMYKHSYGCSAIGADSDGACGNITIAGGSIRILAMNGGAAIGGETSGLISITGGDLAIYTRTRSDGILGSAVSITGGTVSLDANASSNSGCIYCDTLKVAGGNLRVDSSLVYVSSGMEQIRYDLDLSEIEDFDGSCEVLVDGVTYYSGALTQCDFSASAISQGDWSSVASNWIVSSVDSLALYLTPQNHEITVNETTFYLVYGESGFTLLDDVGEEQNPDEGDNEEESPDPDGEDSGDEGSGSDPSDEGSNPDEGENTDENDGNASDEEGNEGDTEDENSGSDESDNEEESPDPDEGDSSDEGNESDNPDGGDISDEGDDNESAEAGVNGNDSSGSGSSASGADSNDASTPSEESTANSDAESEATSDNDSQESILPATGDNLTLVAAMATMGMSAAAVIVMLAAYRRNSL